jgi:4-diphosphocytidyl-2-C-methyl-D-erythritol kinase
MIIFPNAKINLGLNVIRKRSDGYHDIESLMLPIQLCDVLEIIPSPDGQFRFFKSGLPLPDDGKPNLCERAWQLLRDQYGIGPVHIFLHKVIPAGSGLGGGSSDAAFTLKALDQLCNLKLPKDTLVDLASTLGSDCPFFIENQTMTVSGRGEIMEPFQTQTEGLHLLLIVPDVHISTAFAYSKVVPDKPQQPLLEILQEPFASWQNHLKNDFEKAVFPEFPKLQEIKNHLLHSGAVYASMSGSGSALYGLFEKPVPELVHQQFADCFVWKEQLQARD